MFPFEWKRARIEASRFTSVISPRTNPQRMQTSPWQPGQKAAAVIMVSLLLAILIGGGLLARHNLRIGRADRRGAFRLSAVFFVLMLMSLLLRANHLPSFAELEVLFQASAVALLFASIIWVLCNAIEPYFRRLWPSSIVSWNRVFQGRFRDPMVGRDILIGAACGTAAAVMIFLKYFLPERLGLPRSLPYEMIESIESGKLAMASYFNLTSGTLAQTMFLLTVFLLLRVILRKEWLAVIVFLPLMVVTEGPMTSGLSAAFTAASWMLCLFALLKFGTLAFLFAILFFSAGNRLVFTTDLSSWYFTRSVIPLFLLGALAAWAFYISLAGRSLFTDPLGEK